MKKVTVTSVITIAYFLLMSALGVIASVPSNVHRAAKENIRQQISYHIVCPSFITQNSEANEVKAVIQVTPEGKVNVFEVNSANPELKKYVVEELQKMKINHPETNEKFVLVMKFRVV